jgi:hypothetical protein
MALTSNCDAAVKIKKGNGLRIAKYFNQKRNKITPLLHESIVPTAARPVKNGCRNYDMSKSEKTKVFVSREK